MKISDALIAVELARLESQIDEAYLVRNSYTFDGDTYYKERLQELEEKLELFKQLNNIQ